MPTIPFDSSQVNNPGQLGQFLQVLNERVAREDDMIRKLNDSLKQLNTEKYIQRLITRVRAELSAKGQYPLDVTGLHGLLAETQIAQLVVLAADPTVAANNIDANLYDVGTLATFSGQFYYVVAGNPHTWSTVNLSGNFVTLGTAQSITATKTFTVDQIFGGKFSQYLGVALAGTGVPMIVYRNFLSGQTAAIATTNMYTPPSAGEYELQYYIFTTTAGTGNVTFTYSYQDEAGSRGITGAAMALTLSNTQSGSFFFHATTATTLSFSVSYVATGTFAVAVVLKRLS